MSIIEFDSLPSTNLYARQNLAALSHGDIVLARAQTGGRGRLGRRWDSAPGGLYFTLVLKPAAAPPALTQVMALAVCRALKQLGCAAYIKWPNDVLADGKKLCGILAEAVFDKEILKGIIIGCGVNVAQSAVNSDKPAATLAQVLAALVDVKTLLNAILAAFWPLYDAHSTGGFAALKRDFTECFPYVGREVTIGGQTGVIEGVDEEGRLLLNGRPVIAGDMDF